MENLSAQNPTSYLPKTEIKAWYALAVITAVTAFINADRSIMTILVEDIKADLSVSDADIGFIFGTGISIFYALFNIAVGKLSDVWSRKRLMAIGISLCSLMVAMTGMARNFFTLALCRIGVGIGEASLSPASISLIADYFSVNWRARAMSISASGVSLGTGFGIFLGGYILEFWTSTYPNHAIAPMGLKGWQAALIALAIIGLLLSLLLLTIKEPQRGGSEGIYTPPEEQPFLKTWQVMSTIFPVFSLWALYRLGGKQAVIKNLVLLIAFVMLAGLLIWLTGSLVQWVALFFGIYCVACWLQALKISDNAMYSMLMGCKTLLLIFLGVSLVIFFVAAMLTWVGPFYQRVFDVGSGEIGAVIGVTASVAGLGGTLTGGVISDLVRRHTAKAAGFVLLSAIALTLPIAFFMLTTQQLHLSYIAYGLYMFVVSSWYGVCLSLISELVMPRMRATTVALFTIVITFSGFAMGPYCVGYLSDMFLAQGLDGAQALQHSLTAALVVLPCAFAAIWVAIKSMDQDISMRETRAQRLGESC